MGKPQIDFLFFFFKYFSIDGSNDKRNLNNFLVSISISLAIKKMLKLLDGNRLHFGGRVCLLTIILSYIFMTNLGGNFQCKCYPIHVMTYKTIQC